MFNAILKVDNYILRAGFKSFALEFAFQKHAFTFTKETCKISSFEHELKLDCRFYVCF